MKVEIDCTTACGGPLRIPNVDVFNKVPLFPCRINISGIIVEDNEIMHGNHLMSNGHYFY